MYKPLCFLLITVFHATSYSQTTSEDSLYFRAVGFFNGSDMESAASTLEGLLRLYPKSAKAYNFLGAVYAREENYRHAAEMYHRSIQADSSFHMAYMNLGNAYIDMGNLDSAIAIHTLVISKDSTNAEYRNDLGDAYMKMEDVAKAEACFTKAVRLNPYYALAHVNLGVVFARQKRYREAIDELFLVRQLHEYYPRLQDQLYHLTTDAESNFEEWVEREPRNGEAHYYYSFSLYYDGDREDAVKELEEAIRLDAAEDKYYLLKALWLWNMGKYEEALADCRACLDLNSGNWMCHNRMGFSYVRLKDIPKAIEHFRRAAAIDSLVIQSHFALGEAYAVNKEYLQAIDALNRALSLGDRCPLVYYDLAVCYYNLGSYQSAMQNIGMARNRNGITPMKGMEADLEDLQRLVRAKMN